MGGGVPVDIRPLLALLLLGLAYAQTQCSVLPNSPETANIIAQTVYTENGYRPFEAIHTDSVPVEQVKATKLTLVKGQEAVDVELNGAATYQTLFSNAYVEGPFLAGLILDDTLRVGDHMAGMQLRDRFEGRYEFSFGVENVANLANAILGLVSESLRQKPPIKNRVETNSFSVELLCATMACTRELYSLLTKYLNIGASAEMVFEVGLSSFSILKLGALREAGTSAKGVLSKLNIKQNFLSERLKAFLKDVRKLKYGIYESAVDSFKKLSPEEQEIIREILFKPHMASQLAGNLSPNGRKVLYSMMEALTEWSKAKEQLLKKMDSLMGRLKGLVDDKEALKLLEEGDWEGFKQAVQKLQNKERIIEVVGEIEELKGRMLTDDEIDRITKYIFDLTGLDLSYAATVAGRYGTAKEVVGSSLPLITSQFDYIKHALGVGSETGQLTPNAKKALSKLVLAPALFYLTRKNVGGLFAQPLYSPYISNTIASVFPLSEAYALPLEWTRITIRPHSTESFVDIIINGGSDPGDIFKSFLSLTGPGFVNALLERTLGVSLPDFLVLSERKAALYETGKAVALIATPSDCTTCRVTFNDGLSFSAKEVLLALTENRPSQQRAILFFHKANMLANGETVLDMSKEEESCINRCQLLKAKIDPRLGMFLASALLGYGAPLLFGPGSLLPLLLAYPLVSSIAYSGCFSCIDTTLGYYLHAMVVEAEEAPSTETALLQPILSLGKELGVDVNEIGGKVEDKGLFVYAHARFSSGQLEGPLFVQWVRTETVLPTSARKGTLYLDNGEENVVIGEGEVGAGRSTTVEPAASLALPDTSIPGVVIPTNVVVARPELQPGELLMEIYGPDRYTLSEKVRACMEEDLGRLKLLIADRGEVDVEQMKAELDDWRGPVQKVEVYAEKVLVLGGQLSPEGKLETVRLDAGKLRALIFERGVILYREGALYIWQKSLGRLDKGALSAISLEPDNPATLQLTASPSATTYEKELIDKINENLGSIKSINGTDMKVAFVEENGETFLRVYDKNGNLLLNEKVLSVEKDPTDPNTIIVKTVDEEGNKKEHRITIDLSPDGQPILKFDGKNGGVVESIATEKGHLIFHPETGEWELINGIVAPLAQAFTEGIKAVYSEKGGTATPSRGVVINVGERGEMSLPLFEGWELVLLLLLLALLFKV